MLAHSHQPNCQVVLGYHDDHAGILPVIKTIKMINNEDELTIDYGWSIGERDWETGKGFFFLTLIFFSHTVC